MPYAEASDLYLAFGEATIRKYADIENSGDDEHIQERIEWALKVATDDINDRLRCGPYAIPFAEPGSGESYPSSLIRHTALLATSILYDARGVVDESDDEPANLRWARKRVMDWIKDIITRRVRLDVALVTTDVPFIVPNTDPADDDDDGTSSSDGSNVFAWP